MLWSSAQNAEDIASGSWKVNHVKRGSVHT